MCKRQAICKRPYAYACLRLCPRLGLGLCLCLGLALRLGLGLGLGLRLLIGFIEIGQLNR